MLVLPAVGVDEVVQLHGGVLLHPARQLLQPVLRLRLWAAGERVHAHLRLLGGVDDLLLLAELLL
jgi:hypothetical protein